MFYLLFATEVPSVPQMGVQEPKTLRQYCCVCPSMSCYQKCEECEDRVLGCCLRCDREYCQFPLFEKFYDQCTYLCCCRCFPILRFLI